MTDVYHALGGALKRKGRADLATSTRPSGPGFFPVENYGGDINAAATAVAAAGGGTVTLPAGTFSATGFGQNADTAGFFLPPKVSLAGSGRGATFLRVAPGTMTQTQKDSIPPSTPTGPTNPLNVLFVSGGNTETASVYGLAVLGTDQGGFLYNGLRMSRLVAPTLSDVLVKGIPGHLNSPPDETFGVNIFRANGAKLYRVEADGRDAGGNRVGAAGIGTNTVTDVELHDCSAHHMGYSHGLAAWQTDRLTTWNFVSTDNGGASGAATGGNSGAGLNHERSTYCVHYSPQLGNNTLTEVRYYGDLANTVGHELHNLVLTDGGALDIRMDKLQSSTPLLDACPAPVYDYNP